MIDAHRPCAAWDFITEREIQISKDAAIDSGLRRRILGGSKGAFFLMHHGDRRPVRSDCDVRSHGLKVRALILSQVVQSKLVASDTDRVADIHLDVLLCLVAGDYGYPGDEHRHT